jgi:FAD/FMN-containing dehydrogenase
MPSNASASQQRTISVGILQDKMNKTLAHDPTKHTMTIQPGMKLREFAAEATRLGMSVQVGSLPAYAGLTVGGVLSTSGHGSGDQATSNICDTLISLTWVDHQGNIRKNARQDKEVRLFCGGLGLIGLITELEIQLTPPTHTKLITRYLAKDDNMVDDIEKMLKVGGGNKADSSSSRRSCNSSSSNSSSGASGGDSSRFGTV